MWRVLERSQVAVYIIDSRDKLAFFCDDFIRCMNELNLPIMLCLNKGDLVPAPIRAVWSKYFDKITPKLPFSYEFVSARAKENGDGLITPRELVLKANAMAKGPGRAERSQLASLVSLMLVSHLALTQQLEDHVLDHHQHQVRQSIFRQSIWKKTVLLFAIALV